MTTLVGIVMTTTVMRANEIVIYAFKDKLFMLMRSVRSDSCHDAFPKDAFHAVPCTSPIVWLVRVMRHTCLAISKWVDSGMLIIIHSMQWSVNCIYSGINLLLPYSTGPQQYSHTYYYL